MTKKREVKIGDKIRYKKVHQEHCNIYSGSVCVVLKIDNSDEFTYFVKSIKTNETDWISKEEICGI